MIYVYTLLYLGYLTFDIPTVLTADGKKWRVEWCRWLLQMTDEFIADLMTKNDHVSNPKYQSVINEFKILVDPEKTKRQIQEMKMRAQLCIQTKGEHFEHMLTAPET